MNDEQLAKIDASAADCLKACRATEHPFLNMSAFIDGLKADPTWTNAEITELQKRVVRRLL